MSLGGDATAAVSGATLNLTLAASGVTAGSYSNLTVDAKGRITGARAINSSDVTGGLGFTPVNRAGDTMTGNLSAPAINAQTAGAGYLTSATGDSTHTGYIEFRQNGGTRAGYIGYATSGAIQIESENGYNYSFSQRPSFGGYVALDAANGVQKAGDTMTGNLTLPNLYASYINVSGSTSGIYSLGAIQTAANLYMNRSGALFAQTSGAGSAGLYAAGVGGTSWTLRSDHATAAGLILSDASGNSHGYIYGDTPGGGGSGSIGFLHGGGGWRFLTSTTQALLYDASGNAHAVIDDRGGTINNSLTISGQPGYMAQGWAGLNSTFANQFLNFNSNIYRQNGAAWDSSNRRWTAPVSGAYMIMASCIVAGTGDTSYLGVYINGGGVYSANYRDGNNSYPYGYVPMNCHALLNLSAGDYVSIYLYTSNGGYGYAGDGSYYHNLLIQKVA